ncbi:MAG: sigma-70 family RNA polymerase sigma factor [Bacteroidales bacterium]|jgi:RNA polymerase sigma-70 factor (ECF subfamily)|nr:sigma-70 family RNA polymerase sigma factor [Bacteroidota bacterium]NLN98921.1 sigma-70 family RNA polymerase sigma factor [Bacteroidales bacterium]
MRYREFCDIFLPLSDSLYRIAFFILESEADARDALQDLYLKLWNTRDRLNAVTNPKGYCATLLRNLCIDRIRAARRFGNAGLDDREDPAAGVEERLEARERLNTVLSAFESLSEGQREVVNMRIFENMSYDEMAARTGKSKLTLRVLLSTARKTLKERS